MIKVKFPDGEDVIEHILTTLSILDSMGKEFAQTNKVSLDFSEVRWFIPCSIILISNKIREFMDHRIELIEYKPPTLDKARNHLEKVGFPLGNKGDGNSYISIKHFKKDSKDLKQVNTKVNELMDAIESKLPYQIVESMKYIFGELSANIDDHSEFECASLMAQYFPTKEIVDIGVFDNGVSIPGLFERHKISFKGDSEAIRKAVWGEVTTKRGEIGRGYGLRTCKNLSIEGLKGEIYVVSRKGILVLSSGIDPIFYDIKGNSLQGTFLYLRLKKPQEKVNLYQFVE